MPRSRRKLSAVLRDFDAELNRLERYDAENQTRFSSSPSTLLKHQLHLLTEAIFFRGFRAYESFVRDVFLLYCLGKRPGSGVRVTSFLTPRDFEHAEDMIQSSMPILDWANPDLVIQRADLYLKDGFPVKLPYTTHRETLMDFRRIRNHIAHDSKQSLAGFQVVLRRHYGTIPLRIPTPGEFLLLRDKSDPSKYKLLIFFDLMRQFSRDLT